MYGYQERLVSIKAKISRLVRLSVRDSMHAGDRPHPTRLQVCLYFLLEIEEVEVGLCFLSQLNHLWLVLALKYNIVDWISHDIQAKAKMHS